MIDIRKQAVGSAVLLATCGVVVAGVLRSELPCCRTPNDARARPAVQEPRVAATAEIPVPAAPVPAAARPDWGIAPADLKLASSFPSLVEKRFWKVAVKKIWLRPPCCGACSVLKQSDFRTLATVLAARAEDTPANRAIWKQFNTVLMASLSRQEPEMYQDYIHFRKTGKMAAAAQEL